MSCVGPKIEIISMMDETRVFEGKSTIFVTLRKYWYVNSGGGGQGKACHTATTL